MVTSFVGDLKPKHKTPETQGKTPKNLWYPMHAQVQDVGLIFLSSMATAIAIQCEASGLSPQVALGSSLTLMCVHHARRMTPLTLWACCALCQGPPAAWGCAHACIA